MIPCETAISHSHLDTYLDGKADNSLELEIEQHVKICDSCLAALLELAEAPLHERPDGLAAFVEDYVTAKRGDELHDLAHVETKHSRPRVMATPSLSRSQSNWGRKMVRVVAVGLTVCLLFVITYQLYNPVQVQASVEPNPWHSLQNTNRAQMIAQFPDFLALNEMCEPKPWTPLVDECVKEISDPDYSGFEILRDSKVFDMSHWIPVLPEKVQSKRISPVYMTRVQVLRRIPGHKANNVLRYKYWTEGFCVDPLKTSPRDIIRQGTRFDHRAERECRVWELEINVADKPEGEVFTIVTSAIFWNGFPDKPEQWAATAVGSASILRAELGVILPNDRSVKSWSLWKYQSGKQQAKPENRIKAGAPPRESAGIFYWPIAQIDVGHTYELHWTW